MSHMAAQALVKTLLITNSNLGAGTVTEGDYTVLDSGHIYSAVLNPGAFGRHELAEMTRERPWTVLVDLFAKFSDDTTYSALGTLRDSIIETLKGGRCLSSIYVINGIESDQDPQEVFDRQSNGPFFVMQTLRLTLDEYI